MRKRSILLSLAALLLSGCVKVGPVGEACSDKQTTNVSTAKDYAQTLIDRDYETAQTFNYSSEMSDIINNGKMVDLLKSKLDTFGEFKEMQAALCSQGESGDVVTLPMKFSDQNFNLNITFNAESKITGISFSDFTGTK